MLPLTARDTAHRLIAREQAADGAPADAVVVAERALRRLSGELVEWFGPLGAHALLTRALAQARAEHPALAAVTLGAPATCYLDGLAECARTHGAAAMAAGAADVLGWLVHLLGRMIGDTLATTLVEQSGRAGPTGRGAHGSPAAGGAADTGNAGGATGADGDTMGSVHDGERDG